jgi:hypothetical protein
VIGPSSSSTARLWRGAQPGTTRHTGRGDPASGDPPVHAALEFSLTHPDVVSDWHRASNTLAVLAAADEQLRDRIDDPDAA